MKTPFVLMERSAMGNQQKYQILSNELVRRLSNIMIEEIPHNEVIEKIEEFIGELKNSQETVEIRLHQDLTESETWYKTKRDKNQFFSVKLHHLPSVL